MQCPYTAEQLRARAEHAEKQAAKHLANPAYNETILMEAWALRTAAALFEPETEDWFEGTRLEAGHQNLRYGADHDAGKNPADWFWLIGYLAGKSLMAAITGDIDKAKHHTISTAAVLLNWHRHLSGAKGEMRPGIDIGVSAGDRLGVEPEKPWPRS